MSRTKKNKEETTQICIYKSDKAELKKMVALKELPSYAELINELVRKEKAL